MAGPATANGPKVRTQDGPPDTPARRLGSAGSAAGAFQAGAGEQSEQTRRDVTTSLPTDAELAEMAAEVAAEVGLTREEAEQEARDRAESDFLGLDYERDYKPVSDRVRALLSYAATANQQPMNPWENPQVDHEFGYSARPKGTMSRQEWEREYKLEHDFDPSTHVLMVRKARMMLGGDGTPGMFHPGGWQPVARRELPRKLREGWLPRPIYKFEEPGEKRCPVNFMGQNCPYMGKTQEEVDSHMRHYHRDEFSTHEARLNRSATEGAATEQSLTNKLLLRILARNDPEVAAVLAEAEKQEAKAPVPPLD